MKILITGTAGFIGHHLSLKLSALGHAIIGLDQINDYYDVNVKYNRLVMQGINKDDIEYNKLITGTGNISFIKLNLEDKENILRLFKEQQFDYVVNLAAQAGVRYSLTNPEVYLSSNINGFLNILEACRHYPVKHLVYASSSSVYGLNTNIPFSVNSNVDHPISLYGATKKSNELMAHTYSHLFNVPSTGLRFFTVYGPWGRPDMALFIFTKAILNDEPIDVFNNGEMMRDFTYVDDIVESINRLIPKPPTGKPDFDFNSPNPSGSTAPYQVFNIGNNNPVRLMDFIHNIELATNKKAKINFKPLQAGDVPATYAEVQDLLEYIDFKPNTSVKDGINNFITWYRDYYKQ